MINVMTKHLTLLCLLAVTLAAEELPVAAIVVHERAPHPVSNLLFGQMIEHVGKAWEQGPESMMNTHVSPPMVRQDVRQLCKTLNPSIVRFPGGACVEAGLHDWTDLIDHPPGRTNALRTRWQFGYDEALRLAEDHGWEVILPLHLRDALWHPDQAEQHILRSVGLLAYANADPGAALPAGMPDWGAIRMKNGRQEPYGVRYVQIGNEWEAHCKAMDKVSGLTAIDAQVAHMRKVLHRMLDLIRTIDPKVKIILDGVIWSEHHYARLEKLYADGRLRAKSDLLAVHLYHPWKIRRKEMLLHGQLVEWDSLTDKQLWHAMVATPDVDKDGQSVLESDNEIIRWGFALARKHSWPVAMTEWNWNGFGDERGVLTSYYAYGMGAAGFIHALLRSDRVVLACQSMMVGTGWDINSIRVPKQGPAYLHPSGELVAFYRQHHGSQRRDITIKNAACYAQPLKLGSIKARKRVAYLDAVATANEKTLYVHLLNRCFDLAQQISVTLEGADRHVRQVHWHCITGELENHPEAHGKDRLHKQTTLVERSAADAFEIALPPRSISVLIFDL